MMKWKCRGHEFDEFAKTFSADERLWIYGAGEYGKKLYRLLNRLEVQVSFIDGDRQKQLTGCMGEDVISPVELFAKKERVHIIIAALPPVEEEIRLILMEHGYRERADFWQMEDFCQNVLPVYLLYVKDILYMNSVGCLPTTVCNLNCEACLNFTGYNKHQKHRDLDEVKRTLRTYFQAVDYVRLFSYTGGEPLLYPYTDELLEYIGSEFSKQIDFLGVSTNCTIIPEDSTCEILYKYGFHVFLDDYSQYVEKSRELLPRIIKKLEKFHVPYDVNSGSDAYWIDLAPFSTDHSLLSDEEMIAYRGKCAAPFRELRDERLYSCNYASFAIKAGIQEENDNDWYDLRKFTPDKKKELLEFILGYTEKGYLDFCRHCAGYITINPYRKPVGRQVSWGG